MDDTDVGPRPPGLDAGALCAKTSRPSTAGTVARPRLHALLGLGESLPATVVSAAAGYGKTTLLAAWAAAEAPVAWVSLDADDDDPVRLAALASAALERAAPAGRQAVDTLLRAADDPSPERLAAALAADLAARRAEPGLALVLDDVHHLRSAAALAMLDAMLARPPDARIVLSGRRQPPIGALADLLARGRALAVDERDLRFTAAETAELLAAALRPDDPDVARALDTIDGWAAGLRLYALGHGPERLAGSPDTIGAPLFDRLIDAQPPARRAFLAAAAVPDRVSAPLAAAMSGHGTASARLELERLVEERLFVTGDAERGWYRLHPLFRERLLLGIDAADARQTHARASAWFEAEGDVDGAVRHAVAAGDHDAAADLIERHAHAVQRYGPWGSPQAWMRRLPQDVVDRRPMLQVVRADLLTGQGAIRAATATLDRLDALLAGRSDDAARRARLEARGTRCDIAVCTAQPERALPEAAAILADPDASAVARSTAVMVEAHAMQRRGDGLLAVERLEATLAAASDPPDIADALAMLALATVHLHDGRIAEAGAAARRLADAGARGADLGLRWGHLLLAGLALANDDHDAAAPSLAIASAILPASQPLLEHDAALLQALLLADVDLAAARARIAALEADLAARPETPWRRTAASAAARLALAGNDRAAAERWLRAFPSTAPPYDDNFVEDARVTRARVLLRRGTRDAARDALAELDGVAAAARAVRDGWAAFRALPPRAVALDLLGRDAEAMATLREALAFAHDGLRRPFREEGAPMAALVARARREWSGPDLLLIDAALGGAPLDPAAPRLSAREREVLEALAAGLGNAEIAARLFISPNTVKRHLQRIYAALGASSRIQAVEAARRAGLLPPA